jgi:hypothetical protein
LFVGVQQLDPTDRTGRVDVDEKSDVTSIVLTSLCCSRRRM